MMCDVQPERTPAPTDETAHGGADGGDEGDALTALGLRRESAATYRSLVALPDADAAEIAGRTGLTEAVVRAAFEDLLEHGLATGLSPDAPGQLRVRATPPSLALGPLLAGRRDVLVTAENHIHRLAAIYRDSRPKSAGSPVEVVHGRELIAQRFAQIQLSAEHLLEAFLPSYRGRPIVPVDDNPEEQKALRRGVRFVVVMERSWFDHPDVGPLVGDALAAGQELHVVEQVPVQMVLADRRIAMVSLGTGAADGSEPAAAVLHDPGLVEAFRAMFATVRDRGWAITSGTDLTGSPPQEGPDAIDRSILALLNAGLTDVNIARQVGIAPRSVQRRLHRLMRLAEARSRFQLGAHAVRSGWLPDARP